MKLQSKFSLLAFALLLPFFVTAQDVEDGVRARLKPERKSPFQFGFGIQMFAGNTQKALETSLLYQGFSKPMIGKGPAGPYRTSLPTAYVQLSKPFANAKWSLAAQIGLTEWSRASGTDWDPYYNVQFRPTIYNARIQVMTWQSSLLLRRHFLKNRMDFGLGPVLAYQVFSSRNNEFTKSYQYSQAKLWAGLASQIGCKVLQKEKFSMKLELNAKWLPGKHTPHSMLVMSDVATNQDGASRLLHFDEFKGSLLGGGIGFEF